MNRTTGRRSRALPRGLDQVPFAAAANPVDMTAQVMHRPELLGSTARLMLDQGGHGSLLVFLANGVRTEAGWQLQRDLAATLRREFPDRAVVFSALSTSERTRALDALGCASFEDPSSAMHAIAALSHFAASRPVVGARISSTASPPLLVCTATLSSDSSPSLEWEASKPNSLRT